MNSITMQLQADKLIRMALEEDITSEDVSTNAVMPELFKKIAVYIAQNGSCDIRGLIQTMPEVAGSLIRFCKSADAANKELFTLNEFILKAA